MMLDATARLISVTYTGTGLGRMERTEIATDIFCQVGSADRREYFAAYDSGLRPEFRVTTDPVNYSGQTIIELDTAEGTVRCDIYRTYRKSADALELWCVRKNADAVQTFTLWSAGKRVTLFGAYLTGEDGTERTETGRIATDTVTLILPQTVQAFADEAPVAYARPKAYAAMSEARKAEHFCIDSAAFFALGDIGWAGTSKYQDVNAAYDDVYRVQRVGLKNRGTPDSEYLEVIGK